MNRLALACVSFCMFFVSCSPPTADLTATNHFTVYGEVLRQGRYNLDSNAKPPVSIADAIQQAGGFGPWAKASKVKLIRKAQEGNTTRLLNLSAASEAGRTTVLGGDVIIVDKLLSPEL